MEILDEDGGGHKPPDDKPSANRKPTDHHSVAAGRLSARHLDDLRGSGLSDAQIVACGFRTDDDPAVVGEMLGWPGSANCLGECLEIPYFDRHGKPTGYSRYKPDRPRRNKEDGKPIKYESARGRANRAYFPPATRSMLADPTKPLVITEGEKKAARADQDGFHCIGLAGVYGWQKKRHRGAGGKPEGPRELIDDLTGVVWKDREVYVAFDSDIAQKPAVRAAEWQLAKLLKAKGAKVKVVRLAPGPGGEKVGLDDFLVGHTADDLRALLAFAAEARRPDERPVVKLTTRECLAVEEAIKALAARDPNLYQRAGKLVWVLDDSDEAGPVETPRLRPAAGSLRITPVPTATLRIKITAVARVVAQVERKGVRIDVPAHPQRWLVEGVRDAGRWPNVRRLDAVSESPFLRPDGSVCQDAGYDPATAVLLRPNGRFPRVPSMPDRDDALTALDELLEPVADFPFGSDRHRAAFVAAMLTPLARHAFAGPSPLFLVDANVPGAGKGLLLGVVALVATGREFGVAPYSDDDAEMAKVITAVAQAGTPAVLIDNVAGRLGGPSLDAALTATTWEGRLLGKNERPRLPLLAVWYATGNNIILGADTARRTCHIRLESKEERPEERTGFQHPNLLRWVRDNRGRFLAAALTILAAYCRAGRPAQKLMPWGSYEGWSDLVRSAVVWAGMPDPAETRADLASNADSEANALETLLGGWCEVAGLGNPMTVSEALAALARSPGAYPVLREALAQVFKTPHGQLPSAQAVGMKLHQWKNRVVRGECFDRVKCSHNVVKWKVVALEEGGTGGTGGDFSGTPRIGKSESGKSDIEDTGEKSHQAHPVPPPEGVGCFGGAL